MAAAWRGFAWGAVSVGSASLLGYHGYRKKSLDKTGALAAAAVGSLHMLSGFRYGATLVAFYYSSSKMTRYRADVKKRLEADFKDGGQRNWVQVLSNSLTATVLCAALRATGAGLGRLGEGPGLPVALAAGFLGHYACCCADTWASELGILSRSPPRLITTGRPVPPGTNGGVSATGLGASAAGGALVGLAYALAAAADGAGGVQWGVLPFGVAAGLVGSVLDSVLGATVQYSGLDTRSQKVVGEPGPGVDHICGVALLDNHGVNALSSLMTAALAGAAVLSLR